MPAGKNRLAMPALPPMTLTLMAGSVLILILIIGGLLVPKALGIRQLKKDSVEKAALLQRQQILFPLYVKAEKFANMAFSPALQTPERKSINRSRISTLSETLGRLADRHHLTVTRNSLDLTRLNATPDFVFIELTLAGRFSDFRNYLITLAGLPYFNSIEKIHIGADEDRTTKFTTKIRINIDRK